jgi:phage tail sheath gpL-like
MKITVTVKTQAEIQPTKPLSTLELYNLAKTVAGNTLTVTIEDSETVQQLADAADKLMNVDPALTIKEKVVEDGNVLDLTATLSAAGVADGDVVTYSYVIIA